MEKRAFTIIENSEGKAFTDLCRRIIDRDEVFLHHPGSIFGLGASAFSTKAVERIREWKGRGSDKGFIVLIPDANFLKTLGITLDARQERLLSQYWPGNLTVVLPCADPRLQHLALNGTVAFRVPVAVNLRNFIAQLGVPVVSSSVNRTGEPPLEDLRRIRNQCVEILDFALLYKREYLEPPIPSTVIGFNENGPCGFREGAISLAEIQDSWSAPLLLFVCTANICRSPMGEYWMRYLLEEHALDYRTASAGFLQAGVAITENSRKTLAENGIDASEHRSTRVFPELVRSCWRILTMTTEHRDNLRDAFPNAIHKIFTLSEYTGFAKDVADPYGQSLEVYRRTFALIRERCDRLLEKLQG